MQVVAIVLIAIAAAWYGASWKAAMLTEEEEQTISQIAIPYQSPKLAVTAVISDQDFVSDWIDD
jgi:hypothetical protein